MTGLTTAEAADDSPLILEGEGETKTVLKTHVRVPCDQCAEDATQKHTYLLDGARRNPASSAYGRDDCSWCSDETAFTCDSCRRPSLDGYGWCSTFSVTKDNPKRFAHMFLKWKETEINPTPPHGA